jgi:excisionase family DNA binding protein
MHEQNQDLLNIEPAAEILSVSEKWLRRRVGDGTLPFDYYKVGKHLRFRAHDLDTYLVQCRRQAVAS